MADENHELKFPLDFEQCKVCGSTELVIKSLIDKEKAKGKIGADAKPALMTLNALIADMRKPMLAPPVVAVFVDICAKCGTLRCVHAEIGTAKVQIKPGQLLPPNIPFIKG